MGVVWGPDGDRRVLTPSYWEQPFAWDRRAAKLGERHRVFCSSMADVFEGRLELEGPRLRLAQVIAKTPHLDWLLLTKRPENMVRLGRLMGWTGDWPSNVWAGCTVEDQERAEARIPELLKVPARVRFLSCEPLLERVDLTTQDLHRLSWVIVGGESGPKARRFHLEWARKIVRDCQYASVPVFVKQLGERATDTLENVNAWAAVGHPLKLGGTDYGPGLAERPFLRVDVPDRKGGEPAEWPADLRVREVPS